MSLEGDCCEVEITPNLDLLVTFGMSLVEFAIDFTHVKLIPNLKVTKNSLKKAPSVLDMRML
jgi:hypothetical protein